MVKNKLHRYLGIDYGTVRTGIAISDRSNIIATPLETIKTKELLSHLDILITKQGITDVVIGLPYDLRHKETDATQPVLNFISKFSKIFPSIKVHQVDERFTSKMAKEALITNYKKKERQGNKGLIDKISASIILQSYL